MKRPLVIGEGVIPEAACVHDVRDALPMKVLA